MVHKIKSTDKRDWELKVKEKDRDNKSNLKVNEKKMLGGCI